MEPKKVGRTLGIGVRVASNMVRERVERAGAPQFGQVTTRMPIRAAAAKRGVKAFGQAVLTPFTHAGSILWLEITGLFFALFALFFGQSVYRVRADWKQGPEHTHLLFYGALGVGFAWFSFSSFLRAYHKTKRGAKGRLSS